MGLGAVCCGVRLAFVAWWNVLFVERCCEVLVPWSVFGSLWCSVDVA